MLVKSIMGALAIAVALWAAGGDTPLADTAQGGDREGVRSLLKQKADVNAAQGDGMTALHWAAANNDVAMAEMLLSAGANTKAGTRIGAITPLFMASKNGNAAMIEALLKGGADANAADSNGTTPLMIAAASGSGDAVTALLGHGAEVNAKEGAFGQTALMFAAALNRDKAIHVLMKHGADAKILTKLTDPGCGSTFNKTLCGEVDENGDPISDKPDKKKASKEEASKEEAKTDDTKAQLSELRAMIEALTARIDQLEKRPADAKVTAKTEAEKTEDEDADNKKGKKRRRGATVKGGMTALLFAARDGKLDAAKALIEEGADVDDAGAGEKMTPLVMAIANGHYDLAKYLLDHNADPNLASIEGLTPLYAVVDMQWAPYAWRPQPVASQEHISYLELMSALVERGADPNARLKQRVWFRSLPGDHAWVDPAGATAFWRAAQSDDVDAMRLLAKAGADPKLPTTEGVTPLMVAGGLGWAANFSRNAPDAWIEAAKFSLEAGIDVNAKNAKGYTVLHGAAFIGNNDLINFLVEKGADIHAVTKDKNTVADMANGPIAHSNLHPDTIALLEKLGSANSHNCRSDSCLITPKEKEEKPKEKPAGSEKPAVTKTESAPH